MSTAASAVSGSALRDRFSWRAERRPEPGFGHVLGAGAGFFLVLATFSLVGEIGGDDLTVPGILFSLALMALAIVAGAGAAGPTRSACVTVLVLTTPALWFFVFAGDGDGGRGTARLIYLLSLAVYAVLFVALWTRGRGPLLAAVLIVFTGWVLFEVGGDSGGVAPFQDQIENPGGNGPILNETEGPGPDVFDDESDTSTETSSVALALGLIYLGAAWRLDRQGLRGLATPLIAVGAIAGIAGAISLGAEESVLAGGLSAVAIGAVVGIIGGLGLHRRGTTWVGVLFIVGGLVTVAADTTEDPLGLAGLFALFALVMIVVGVFASQKLGEHPDGDEEATPLGAA